MVSENCQCGKGESVTLNSLGNLEFTVQDSLMIVSTAQNENAWKIVDLRSDSIVSEVINSGHGEWNLIRSRRCSWLRFSKMVEI